MSHDETESKVVHAKDIATLSGKRVLVIDDDLVGLGAMSQVLSSFGMSTTLAQSEARALEIAKDSGGFDFILSDFRLSEDIDGITLIKKLLKLPGLQDVPSLIVTGDTAPTIVELIEQSRIDYMHKPVKPELLGKKLEKLLKSSNYKTVSAATGSTVIS